MSKFEEATIELIKKVVKMNWLGSEVDKPSKILIKTLNAVEYIELDIQNTEATRVYDHLIYYM